MLSLFLFFVLSAHGQDDAAATEADLKKVRYDHCRNTVEANNQLRGLAPYQSQRQRLEMTIRERMSQLDQGSATLMWKYVAYHLIEVTDIWMPVEDMGYTIDPRAKYRRLSNREYDRLVTTIKRLERHTDSHQQAIATLLMEDLLKLAKLDQKIAADTVAYLHNVETAAALARELERLSPSTPVPVYQLTTFAQCYPHRSSTSPTMRPDDDDKSIGDVVGVGVDVLRP